jgi:riboflavin synthase
MLIGIIEDMGLMEGLVLCGEDTRLSFKTDNLDMSEVSLGHSLANNGVCLTVVKMSKNNFSADV